jgi:cobyrinic acid a,c-diamide synthase
MYLCENIVDIRKKSFHMVGCFPLEVSMLPRLTSLGYRRVTIESDSPVGKPEEVLKGHEFRCSEIKEKSDNYSRVYEVSTSAGSQQWKEGYQRGNILGSNIHIHFGSRPGSLERFVRTCLAYKQKKSK